MSLITVNISTLERAIEELKRSVTVLAGTKVAILETTEVMVFSCDGYQVNFDKD